MLPCIIARAIGSIARRVLGNYDASLHQLFQRLQSAAWSQAHGLGHFRSPGCAMLIQERVRLHFGFR